MYLQREQVARAAAVEQDIGALERRQILGPIGGILTSLLGVEPDETTTRRLVTVTNVVPPTQTRPGAIIPTTSSTSSSRTTQRSTASQVASFTPPPPVQFTTRTTTATSTGQADNSQNGQSTPRKGLPPVVIGIIVAAAVIFGLIFIALVARKFFQKRRRNKRTTWGGSMISPYEPPLAKEKSSLPIITNSYPKAPPPPPSVHPGMSTAPSTYPSFPPAAANFTGNNANSKPNNSFSPVAASSSNGYYPFAGVGSSNAKASTSGTQNVVTPTALPQANQLSVVKRTFVPSLPDELSIANGETVRILSVYDDGWALCEKMNGGEKGVVPQECLESVSSSSNTPKGQIGNTDKGIKRNSSLRRDQANLY